MKERLAPYDGIMKEPHETRGTFEECRFRARIAGREYVDNDPDRRTAKVTIDISNSGLTVLPGDRLTLMPKNNSMEVEKIVCALDFYSILDNPVPLVGGWEEYWRHMFNVYRGNRPSKLTVRELLYNGNLSPLSKELIKKVPPIGSGVINWIGSIYASQLILGHCRIAAIRSVAYSGFIRRYLAGDPKRNAT